MDASSSNYLSINSGVAVTFNNTVGSTNHLSGLSISASHINLPSSVTTTGTQAYYGAVSLSTNTTITTSSTGVTGGVSFYGTVDAPNGSSLSINTVSTSHQGSVNFLGAVGATAAIGGLTISAGTVNYSWITSSNGITINSSGFSNGVYANGGVITNTGGTGTGIVIQANGNLYLNNITNSCSLGILLAGGYGVAAGNTTSGGTISNLGLSLIHI